MFDASLISWTSVSDERASMRARVATCAGSDANDTPSVCTLNADMRWSDADTRMDDHGSETQKKKKKQKKRMKKKEGEEGIIMFVQTLFVQTLFVRQIRIFTKADLHRSIDRSKPTSKEQEE